MKKLSFFSVIVALTFMFSACDKSASDQIADEDVALNVKGSVVIGETGGSLQGEIAYSWNGITSSMFASFPTPPFNNWSKALGDGITVFRSDPKNQPVKGFNLDDYAKGAKFEGNGNDPVFLWFDAAVIDLLEVDYVFYLGVRYKESNNVLFGFNVKACAAWCAANGPISLQWEAFTTLDLGPVTQVRIQPVEAVEPPPTTVTVKFFRLIPDEDGNLTVQEEFYKFENVPLTAPLTMDMWVEAAASEGAGFQEYAPNWGKIYYDVLQPFFFLTDCQVLDHKMQTGDIPDVSTLTVRHGWKDGAGIYITPNGASVVGDFLIEDGVLNITAYWAECEDGTVPSCADCDADSENCIFEDGVFTRCELKTFKVIFLDKDGETLEEKEVTIGDKTDCPDDHGTIGDCQAFIGWQEVDGGADFDCDNVEIYRNYILEPKLKNLGLSDVTNATIEGWRIDGIALHKAGKGCYTESSWNARINAIKALTGYDGCDEAEVTRLIGLINSSVLQPAGTSTAFDMRLADAKSLRTAPICPDEDYKTYLIKYEEFLEELKGVTITACEELFWTGKLITFEGFIKDFKDKPASTDFLVRLNKALTKLSKPDCEGADWAAYLNAYRALPAKVNDCDEIDPLVIAKIEAVEAYYFPHVWGTQPLLADQSAKLAQLTSIKVNYAANLLTKTTYADCFEEEDWLNYKAAYDALLAYELLSACADWSNFVANMNAYLSAETALLIKYLTEIDIDSFTGGKGVSKADDLVYKNITLNYLFNISAPVTLCGGRTSTINISIAWNNNQYKNGDDIQIIDANGTIYAVKTTKAGGSKVEGIHNIRKGCPSTPYYGTNTCYWGFNANGTLPVATVNVLPAYR